MRTWVISDSLLDSEVSSNDLHFLVYGYFKHPFKKSIESTQSWYGRSNLVTRDSWDSEPPPRLLKELPSYILGSFHSVSISFIKYLSILAVVSTHITSLNPISLPPPHLILLLSSSAASGHLGKSILILLTCVHSSVPILSVSMDCKWL